NATSGDPSPRGPEPATVERTNSAVSTFNAASLFRPRARRRGGRRIGSRTSSVERGTVGGGSELRSTAGSDSVGQRSGVVRRLRRGVPQFSPTRGRRRKVPLEGQS